MTDTKISFKEIEQLLLPYLGKHFEGQDISTMTKETVSKAVTPFLESRGWTLDEFLAESLVADKAAIREDRNRRKALRKQRKLERKNQ
jgi:hypothetical protein